MNGPDSIVVSGMIDVVEKVLLELGKKGVYLQVSHAFHSPLMRGMEARFGRVIGLLDIQQPLTTPIASTVIGRVMLAGERIDTEHLVKQLASPVIFEDALKETVKYSAGDPSFGIVIEVGPKPILSKLAQSMWKTAGIQAVPLWIASLEEEKLLSLIDSLAAIDAMFNQKTPVASSELSSIFPNRTRLPWPETPPHPLLQYAVPIGSHGTEFHTVFHDKLMEFYSNHVIQGRTIFPGAGYIEMGLAAGALMSMKGIEDVRT